MSDDDHDMSILSLKHLSQEDQLEEQVENKKQRSQTTTTATNINSTANNNTNQPSSNGQIQSSQTNIHLDAKGNIQNYSSCTSTTLFNKISMTDLGFFHPSNTEFPIDQNSVGANFLRSMFQSNQPMKNYMNYLKKDTVDLTDERDAMAFKKQEKQLRIHMKIQMKKIESQMKEIRKEIYCFLEQKFMFLFVQLLNEMQYQVVMQILQKPTKSKNECDFLLKSIQGLHLFQKNKDMLTMKDCNQQLLEKLRLEYFPSRKTIFNYGDFGYTYYIVLQGECDLMIPAPVLDNSDKLKKEDSTNKNEQKDHKEHKDHKEQHQQKEMINDLEVKESQKDDHAELKENASAMQAASILGGKLGKKKIKLDSKWNVLKKTFNPDQENMNLQENSAPAENEEQPLFIEDESHEEFLKRCFTGMNYIKTFKAGEAFGEIALMTKQRRTGTLVCRENTYLMALTKESFDIILGSYHENIIQRKLNFLKSFYFFRSMPNSKLLSLLHFMKVVNYRNKNIVFTEKDPSRFLYFIREGEVEISQICNIETNPEKEKKKKEEGDDNPNDINAIKAQKDLRNKKKRIPIVIKGKNSYFGEDEILKHIDTRKQQAICNSETAEIFLLKKDILYNYTRGYSVIEKLKEEFKVKGEWNQIRQAKIVQTTQNTKNDIEKQINLLSLKGKTSSSMSNIQEPKGLDNRSSMTNIFSLNQNKNNLLSVPAGSISMNSINSSGNKRQSLMNPYSTNPLTPSQNGGCSVLDPAEIISSKQRLSLRTNPFNPNSLNTLQRQLTLANSKQSNQHSSNDENNEHFFSTGVGQSTINGFITEKLTPETKIHLKLKPQRKGSYNQAAYGMMALESQQQQTPQSTHPLTLTEEENYIENKILHNKMRKYLGETQKTREQLAQVALEQFGDMSHNAFVNKVGQTIEYKMQILKKLNQNGLQSPTNVFADLYEEFGLKKKLNFKVRKSVLASNPSMTPKESSSKNLSAPNGHEFQKRILLERKIQIKENIKKQNTQTFIEDINLISEQIPEHLQRGKTFHQQFSYSLQNQNTHDTFVRHKTRASTSINFHHNYQSSSSQDSRIMGDKQKSFDEVSLSGYESQNSQGSITIPKRNSFTEKALKNPSGVLIKNLDVLEEVSENNSPVKLIKDAGKKRLSNLTELKSLCSQEYGLTQSLLLPKNNGGSQSRIILESISTNKDNEGAARSSGQIQLELKPQLSIGSINGGSSTNTNSQNNDTTPTSTIHSSLYSNKSFMNRNMTSLKQKQEARRAIARNSSSHAKENSFKISTKQNNFFSLQKTMHMCQSQGNLQSIYQNNNN